MHIDDCSLRFLLFSAVDPTTISIDVKPTRPGRVVLRNAVSYVATAPFSLCIVCPGGLDEVRPSQFKLFNRRLRGEKVVIYDG